MMKSIVKIGFLLTGLALYSILGAQTICKCTIPLDNGFQIAPMTQDDFSHVGVPPLYENNNATTPAMALPFNFCFYGTSYDSVFISNNGIVSFVKPVYRFIDSPATVPLGADTIIIAPFWANANTLNNNGVVYYKITPTYMVVFWDSVRYAGVDVDGWNTFQLVISNGTDPIIPNGNNVQFCYPIMQWACSDSSGGFSGYGGTPAFIGINKGDGTTYAQLGTFALPGDYYYGPFAQYNGVEWLDFNSFMFNTCVSNNVIAPVIFDDFPAYNTLYICPCDTTPTESALHVHDSLLVQPCDTFDLTATFLCAQQNQNAVLSYSYTGSLYIYSVYSSTANIIDTITVQFIPAFGDTGIHTLSLTATDTVNHLSSTVTYTLNVTMDCLTAGINEPVITNNFAVYPNPAESNFTIKTDGVWGNTTAKLYTLLGAQVLSAPLTGDKSNIDVSTLARGMYFVELFKEGVPLGVKRIIIQ